jgi:putative Mn2+ efflux pump MntP
MSSTDNPFYVSPVMVKPVVAGVVSGILDRVVLKREYLSQNVSFGVAVAVGTSLGEFVGGYVPQILPDISFVNGKTVGQRAIELGIGSGSAYVVNRYVLTNDGTPSLMLQRLGVIFVSQFISEYAADYLSSAPLSYFA